MNIAILLQCHKNPNQVSRLLNELSYPGFTTFLHVDRKSSILEEICLTERTELLPCNLRVNVEWGRFSQVQASLNLLTYSMNSGDYDYFWLCSGQDFPIKSMSEIYDYLANRSGSCFVNLVCSKNYGNDTENNMDKRNAIYYPNWMLGSNLMRRIAKRLYIEMSGGYKNTYSIIRRKNPLHMNFYYGSSWICISRDCAQWIMRYLEENQSYEKFYKNCNCPDESFFQTLIMNSPYAEKREEYLHFIRWEQGSNSPNTLTINDYEELIRSSSLMARKFDSTIDNEILNLLEQHNRAIKE